MTAERLFLLSRDDWSLHRKGQLDQMRHQERVREAIRENLSDLISEESIILNREGRKVKVPIRTLEEVRFRFNRDKQSHVGQGDGTGQPGDSIGRAAPGAGQGFGAGDQPGEDIYEAEVSEEELAAIVFEGWELPDLKQKEPDLLPAERPVFDDIRKRGLMGNLDKKRTYLESLKRSLREGSASPTLRPEDLRFKTWNDKELPQSKAAVFAMMDTSGSMGTFQKWMARAFFHWMVRFLKTQYPHVETVFLAHHTEAMQVTEEQFFHRVESGGTRCSSVYELALQLIETRYSAQRYNLYAYHFTDGDNLTSDNEPTVELTQRLIERCNRVGYGEINPNARSNTLMQHMRIIKHPAFVTATFRSKEDIHPALKRFFSRSADSEGGSRHATH